MCEVKDKLSNLWLREATPDDMMLLFCWANDPVVRCGAFCTEEIAMADHRRWFRKVLSEENIQIFILQRGDIPVGQVRIEASGYEWNIDYSIDAAWRGNGYGRMILYLLEKMVANGTYLLGKVKFENIASQKVFESLGYRKYVNEDNCIVEYRKCTFEHGEETCLLAANTFIEEILPCLAISRFREVA